MCTKDYFDIRHGTDSICQHVNAQDGLKALYEQLRNDGPNIDSLNLKYVFLEGADLRGAYLAHADLSHARILGTDFSDSPTKESILFKTNFFWSAAYGAKFVGADLYSANFGQVTLSGADFSHTELIKTDFQSARMNGTNFWRIDAQRSEF